ncbi:MAG: serine/threonine protein kinase [Verrucomicrobia bacterium]|nr:MAG: serine/threonine protein kinase [Verrucomicrobiota bacterium]
MSARDRCKECGAAISAGSPSGLCGKCLFGLGLQHDQGAADFENSAAAQEGPILPHAARPEVTSKTPNEAARLMQAAPLTERPGDVIGNYKLLQEIGQGGFGVVYMAQQQEPVRRRVALKIVKLGMDTKAVVARFEAERQALALMDHPNIAKMLDAGATETGRPYFVMELVKGIRITDYCDQNNLSPRERLEIFVQICRAVQHAHQKGIIHRDIKPSNILITLHDGVPVPKIIDFGIAKATQQELTEHTVFTQFGQFIGTPAYMSPEQAEMSGLDVDTRSDIYSLGVLLYELLTGKTPFDPRELMAAGMEAMRRTLREKEPARPSTRLSTLEAPELTLTAKHRRVEAPKLVRLVRGDLDWIVMKCLEKDRTRRYESASRFADDIENFLKNEPISARPPSRVYQFQRMVRRNKLAFAAATAVLLAIIAGLVVSTWMFCREREARLRSQEVAQFLKDMLHGIDPEVARGRDSVLREILDKAVQRIATKLRNQPLLQAELYNTIGETYLALAQFDQSERMHRTALDLQRKAHAKPADLATSLDDLGIVLRRTGNLDEAESREREAVLLCCAAFGRESGTTADALNDLALVLRERGQLADAEAMQREVLAIQTKVRGPQNIPVATALNNLAFTLRDEGKFAEAEKTFRDALSLRRKLDEKSPRVGVALDNLALIFLEQWRYSEAEATEKEALSLLQSNYAPDHPAVAAALHTLARVYCEQGKLAEANDLHRRVLAMRQTKPTDESREIANSLDNLALVLRKQKKLDEAEELERRSLQMRKRIYQRDDHPAVAYSLDGLGLISQDQKRLAEAEMCFYNALKIETNWLGAEHPRVATTLNNLALLLRDQGKRAEAEQTLRQALAMRVKLLGEQDPASAKSRRDLDELLLQSRSPTGGQGQASGARAN